MKNPTVEECAYRIDGLRPTPELIRLHNLTHVAPKHDREEAKRQRKVEFQIKLACFTFGCLVLGLIWLWQVWEA